MSSPPEGATARNRPPRGGLPNTTASGRGSLFEAFPTDAIRGLPEDDECFADRLRVDPPAGLGRIGHEGIDSGEEADRMLTVAAGDVDDLIEYLSFLDL